MYLSISCEQAYFSTMRIDSQQLLIHIVRKSTPRFTKSPSLVLIGLVLTEIQAFKNVKKLQRNVWKIRINADKCPDLSGFHTFPYFSL